MCVILTGGDGCCPCFDRSGNNVTMFNKFSVTVAAIAVSTCLASPAIGAEKSDFWVEGKGMVQFWDGKANLIGDGTGKVKPKTGAGFAGEIGFKASEYWSFLIRAKHSFSSKSNATSQSETRGALTFLGADVANKEKYTAVDLEALYMLDEATFGKGMQAVAGIRVVDFRVKENGRVNDNILSITGKDDVKRSFSGLGPKIGFKMTKHISEDFYFDADAAFAALFGKRKFKKNRIATGANDFTKRSKSIVVPNIDAYVGVAYKFPELNGMFKIGYGVDAYFNILDSGCNCFLKKGNRIIHGVEVAWRQEF